MTAKLRIMRAVPPISHKRNKEPYPKITRLLDMLAEGDALDTPRDLPITANCIDGRLATMRVIVSRYSRKPANRLKRFTVAILDDKFVRTRRDA